MVTPAVLDRSKQCGSNLSKSSPMAPFSPGEAMPLEPVRRRSHQGVHLREPAFVRGGVHAAASAGELQKERHPLGPVDPRRSAGTAAGHPEWTLSNRASDRPARILEVQLEWDTLPSNGNFRGTAGALP